MNYSTCDNIDNISLNNKEIEHTSRTRIGVRVFVSRYFHDFKKLTCDGKLQLIGTVREDVDIDDCGPVDTPPVETVKSYEVMRLACKCWRKLRPDLKNSWNQRAKVINDRLLLGRFYILPYALVGHDIESIILQSITIEWTNISHKIQNSIRKDPSRKYYNVVYVFSHKRVSILLQIYCSFTISSLLTRCTFGK